MMCMSRNRPRRERTAAHLLLERKLPALPPTLPAKVLSDALDALGVVMDAYAQQGHDQPGRIVSRDRRSLWAAANVIRRLGYMCEDQGMPDFLATYKAEPGLPPHGLVPRRCLRPTKSGAPCAVKLSFGRLACHMHATPEEQMRTYEWQASVHLPFPRARVGNSAAVRDASLALVKLLQEMS